jgi:hypothetical protein
MVEEVVIFRDWLREAATSGEKITLAEKSEKLTVDIIGRTVL